MIHNKTKDGKARPFLLYDGRCAYLAPILRRFGVPLPLPPYGELPEPVCGHPDLLILPFSGPSGKTLYTYSAYRDAHRALFDALPMKTEAIDEQPGAYPRDLWLDGLILDGRLFAKAGCVPAALAGVLPTVPVNQGYARCSTLVLPDARAVITADKGISNGLRRIGWRALLITPGHIVLPGYDCGFIGGASAVIGKTVLFFGDLRRHPDGEEMRSFIVSCGYRASDAPSLGELRDCGGVIVQER